MELLPTHTSHLEVSEDEYFAGAVLAEDGSIYISIRDMSSHRSSTPYSLVRYYGGVLSSRIFNYSWGYIYTLQNRVFIYGEETEQDNVSLIEIDPQGNVLEKTDTTFGMDDWHPVRFFIGSDGLFYLSTITNIQTTPELHLIKMNANFNIIWDKAFNNKPANFLFELRDMKILPNGQIFILMYDNYLESLDSNGNFHWNETLNSNPNRIVMLLSIVDDSSVCVYIKIHFLSNILH